jgi:hypothetical protein
MKTASIRGPNEEEGTTDVSEEHSDELMCGLNAVWYEASGVDTILERRDVFISRILYVTDVNARMWRSTHTS